LALRGQVAWPNGARCALAVAWDIDFDTTVHLEEPGSGYSKYEVLSDLRYEDVGLPSVLEALGELGLHNTFFVSSWNVEQYPAAIQAIAAQGHEVACHGVMHEPPNQQSDERELDILRRSRKTLQESLGIAVTGYRAPYAAFSHRTAGYLAGEGFAYDSSLMNDHLPYIIKTESGRLIELPIDIAMSDAPHFAHVPSAGYTMQPQRAEEAIAYYHSVIEAALEINGFVCTIWHPAISGRPERLLPISRYLKGLQARSDVWMAPMAEVAGWVREWSDQHPGGVREVTFPLYSAAVEVP
jgi:peptidoglycan/xylan/chitin deacetylase (PgdA/CDA1 family)